LIALVFQSHDFGAYYTTPGAYLTAQH
jgi:hypothetical protein